MEKIDDKNKISPSKFTIVPNRVLWDNTLSLGAKGLYAYLCDFYSHNAECFPINITKFRKDLGIDNKEIQKYLDELFSHHILEFQVSGTMYEDMEYIVTLI